MKFRQHCLVIALCCFASCGVIGCTLMLPQSQLDPLIKDHLGRELVVRVNGEVLNPIGEELYGGANAEVDVQIEVVGYWGMYRHTIPWTFLLSVPFPAPGISILQCAERKQWQTDAICTCQIYLMFDWPAAREHELRHCMGYGEM